MNEKLQVEFMRVVVEALMEMLRWDSRENTPAYKDLSELHKMLPLVSVLHVEPARKRPGPKKKALLND